MLACGARFQPTLPSSNPPLLSKLFDVVNMPSGLDLVFPYASVLLALKWKVVLLVSPERVSEWVVTFDGSETELPYPAVVP
jgi:hypothetical protein